MKDIKNQHRNEMAFQINSQDPLSDLPRLHVGDECNIAAKMATLEICRYPGNSSLEFKVEIKMIANNIKNGLKTLSCHFEFYIGEKYIKCLLEDFSDYNRWSIDWGNPIISDDR